MTREQLKTIVRNEIANAQMEAALEKIDRWAIDSGDQQLQKDVSLLKGELNTLNRSSNLGLISYSDATMRRNQLVNATLSLLDTMPAPGERAPDGHQAQDILKVLMFTVNAAGMRPLNTNNEVKVIFQKLQEDIEKIRLLLKGAVNVTEFRELTEEENPQILHFSGHGEEGDDGGLIFHNDEKNGNELVSIAKLAALFKFFRNNGIVFKAVILNACFSEGLAKALSENDVYVIGTTTAIADSAAIGFSGGFYYQLARTGFNYERAFDSGRIGAVLDGADESHFVIYKNGQKLAI